ncbi:MAG: 4-aminobutyrate--2-oxoglutarate transaminase [Deferrisomatales bacterium]
MGERSAGLDERRKRALPRGIACPHPQFVAEAQGARLVDVDGREYIDFASGIGVNNVGNRHPAVAAAVVDQAGRYLHTCFSVMMYEPYVELAERLNRVAPCRGERRTMLANSGAEAVENAVKIARAHTGRRAVLCFDNAFHGRTQLTLALTSKLRPYKAGLGAHAPEVTRIHYPYCYRCPWGRSRPGCGLACGEAYFETYVFKQQVDPSEVAAVILEPVQGEGGFITPPPEYLAQVRRVCDRHGIVLIADEIQSGFARTGRMFATEHFGVEVDLVALAKSLAGGLPLSAVTGTAEIMDAVAPGGLGTTYGGNPVACRAALATLEVIETEGLVARAEALGRALKSRYEAFQAAFPVVGDVRGLGAMLALELVRDRATKEPAADEAKALVAYCRAQGLILLACGTFGNIIRTLAPLTISAEDLGRGLDILEAALRHVSA